MKKTNKGNILVTVLLIIAAFGLMIPAIVMFVKNEANWSVKERKQTEAFHLAESANDRGDWKLSETPANWATITSGSSIVGYANDVVYSDVTGGSYKINIYRISSTSVGIIATAKDAAGKEFRAIRSIYGKSSIVAPIQVPSYSAGGNFMVWWGPIYSVGDISVSGASNRLYPRKMARGRVSPRATAPGVPNPTNIDSNANPEWWSYNSYPVPDAPTPDLAWYEAQSHISPNEYYSTFKSFSGVDTTSKIRWCAAGGEIASVGTFLRGYIFSMGDFSITKKGGYAYTVTPPADAWKEYTRATPGEGHADTADDDEYPGDGGYHTVKPYTFGETDGGAPNKLPAFRGFLYVTGTFSGGANALIHGAIVVTGGGGFGGGGADLFYDDTLNIQFSNSATGARTSWEEITPTPF
ncbi:MAG: hypothetical protein NTX32_07610 [Candidatus Firestonebacteria bacterium]|nr:hypothetical protein [Candidatus Firestonebacteria bacterium]